MKSKKATNFEDFIAKINETLKENGSNEMNMSEVTITIIADKNVANEAQIAIIFDNNYVIAQTGWDFFRSIEPKISKKIQQDPKAKNASVSITYGKGEYETFKTNVLSDTEWSDLLSKIIKKKKWIWADSLGIEEGTPTTQDGKITLNSISIYNTNDVTTIYNKIDELIKQYYGKTPENYILTGDNMGFMSPLYYNWEDSDGKYEFRVFVNQINEDVLLEYSYTATPISYVNSTETGKTKVSLSYDLQQTISKWYKALRTIALVGLLSVLVYVGIRIIISSTGQEKAKYKKMIGDWLAAICILFVLHYIMAITMTMVEEISKIFTTENIIGPMQEDVLMSTIRGKVNTSGKISASFTELIMYLVLVIYTVVFTIHYLKRLIYLAFFTMIAPLIALTYPLDKIKDRTSTSIYNVVKRVHI